MIQLSRAPIRHDDVGILQRVAAAAPTDSGWVSGITPLPIGEARNGSLVRSMNLRNLVLGARVGHALADDDERPLRRPEHVQRALDVLGHGLGAWRVRAARRSSTLSSSTLPVMMSSGMSR
jgi:hypothetical protein